MITPLDIQNKEFSKGVRGYKEDEVDEFLDLLTVDYEKLIAENAALKEQVAAQNIDLDKYRGSENTVLETLEAAKRLMGDISASAEKRAEILLKNAELDAELIQREARENVERLTEENANLKRRFAEFRTRYKSLLESELERFETMSSEIYTQYGMDDLKDIASPETGKNAQVFKTTPTDDFKTRIMEPIKDEKPADDMAKTMVNFKPIRKTEEDAR
ncbi:MAG: DivIVA domain-containing protein [Firmicutes bacterium]|nr:DivIVA domain-containing protein [Bacillota bacterium]